MAISHPNGTWKFYSVFVTVVIIQLLYSLQKSICEEGENFSETGKKSIKLIYFFSSIFIPFKSLRLLTVLTVISIIKTL